MKSLATALGLMLVTSLAASAAAPIKEAQTQEKIKAPVVAMQRSIKLQKKSCAKKLLKRSRSATPVKTK